MIFGQASRTNRSSSGPGSALLWCSVSPREDLVLPLLDQVVWHEDGNAELRTLDSSALITWRA